jgi:hypothetical protein
MTKPACLLVGITMLVLPAASIAADRFDGSWQTKITCPAKGNTEGFTWNMESTIQNSNLRAERGTAGEPGYFLLEGKVNSDGSAKLTGSGIVKDRKYAKGVFVRKGSEYTWDVKAQFKDADGTGLRNEGLGIVGRPCTFEFVREPAAPGPAATPAQQ